MSKYKGVTWFSGSTKGFKKRWRASITPPGKTKKTLGYFLTQIEAARAYDTAAIRCFGVFAQPNFSQETQ